MKHILLIGAALGSLLGGAAVAQDHTAGDKAQIKALWHGWNAAFQKKDPDGVMAFYARQGLYVFDVIPPRAYVGWEAYRKDFQGLFATFPGPLTSRVSDVGITVVGTVAYSHMIDEAVFTARDGSKVPLTVRVTDVYRKSGGQWKIVQEHVSVPVDLANGKPDMLSKL